MVILLSLCLRPGYVHGCVIFTYSLFVFNCRLSSHHRPHLTLPSSTSNKAQSLHYWHLLNPLISIYRLADNDSADVVFILRLIVIAVVVHSLASRSNNAVHF